DFTYCSSGRRACPASQPRLWHSAAPSTIVCLSAPVPAGATMTEAHLFVIGILLAWLAGIRVYLTVFGVGLAGLLGWVDLPPALQATESWWVLGTSAVLAIAEFFADKIPGVDSAWDLLQTLARVPAGA